MSSAPAAQLQATIARLPQASATDDPTVESRLVRLAQTALIALALCVGLGDIAQVSPPTTVVLDAVHALLPCAIGLAAVCALRERRGPPVSRAIGLPLAAWLSLQLLSAVTAPSYQHDALATLQRPVSGALLVCAVVVACRNHSNWLRLMKALALGGLG